MELTKNDINNILAFLDRTTGIGGNGIPTSAETMAFNIVYAKLQQMLKEPEKEPEKEG